ncbi:MAG: hypothetical protein LBU89_11985, partial [Fibromonadaceae bacterium]|nr:hypothetical protein [Fibromonadaceae bacterium]
MKAEWVDGGILRSGTRAYKQGEDNLLQETVCNSLHLRITGAAKTGNFKIDFPVGDAASGALFTPRAALLADCTPPEGWSVSKCIDNDCLCFMFSSPTKSVTEIYLEFESLICDTGEGVSLVRLSWAGVEHALAVYRSLSNMKVSFFGDTFGDYMSEIKIGWRVDNAPKETKLFLVPSDDISGREKLGNMQDERFFPLLCDITYMLIVTINGETVETLYHTVSIRPSEVLEFRAVKKNGNKYHIRYLLKNRRYAFLTMGIGRLNATRCIEEDGNVYAEFDGEASYNSSLTNQIPMLCWPPDFTLSPVYLKIEGTCDGKNINECRYGAIESDGKAIAKCEFKLENAVGSSKIISTPSYSSKDRSLEKIRLKTSDGLEKTHDIVYRLRFENIGWLGWDMNDNSAGINVNEDNIKCTGVEAKLVKKGWGSNYVSAPGQLPAFVDYSQIIMTVTPKKNVVEQGKMLYGAAKITWSDEQILQIEPVNGAEKLFDICYMQKFDATRWTGWAVNGEPSGIVGGSLNCSAPAVKIVPKGCGAIYSGGANQYPIFLDYAKTFATIQTRTDNEWNQAADNGASGPDDEENPLPLTGFRLSNEYVPELKLEYKGCYSAFGWDQNWQNNEYICERADSFIEGIVVKIAGKNADLFDIVYRISVEKAGWLGWAKNGEFCGVIGLDLPATAIEVKLLPKGKAPSSTKLNFTGGEWTIVQWDQAVKTLGLEKSEINATKSSNTLQMQLTGEAVKKYDLVYNVRTSKRDWLGWATNNEKAGSNADEDKITDVRLRLLPKDGAKATAYTTNNTLAFWDINNPNVGCETFDGVKWVASKSERETPVTDIRFGIAGISYSVYPPDASNNGNTAQPIHAICLKAEGEIAEKYDLHYRVQTSGLGWLGWAKSEQSAGTKGAKPIHAIDVKLTLKGKTAPSLPDDPPAFVDYTAVAVYAEVYRNENSAIKDFKLHTEGLANFEIECKGYYDDAAQLEAIEVCKTGKAAELFDLFFRLHSAEHGWLGWTKNDKAGIIGGKQLFTDMEFRLKPKRQMTETVKRFNRPPAFIDMNELSLRCEK